MALPASWIAVKLSTSTLPVSRSTSTSVKLTEKAGPAPCAFRVAMPEIGPPVLAATLASCFKFIGSASMFNPATGIAVPSDHST